METNTARICKEQHSKAGIKLDYNQTVKKGCIYLYISGGYTYGGYNGYYKVTVVEAIKDDFFALPGWTNKQIFKVIYRSGKLFGNGKNTEFDRKIQELKNDYKQVVIV